MSARPAASRSREERETLRSLETAAGSRPHLQLAAMHSLQAHTACSAAALDAAADRGVGGATLTCRLPVPCSCAGVLLPSSRCQGPD